MKLIGSKKKSSLMLEGKFDEDFLSNMSEGGDSGARMLFKMLQGKISLKETELDAFGFEEDSEDENVEQIEPSIATSTVITSFTKTKTKSAPTKVEQTTLFTITDEEMQKLSAKVKKKNKVVEGQISFFSLA